MGKNPAARLMFLADKWDVDYRAVSRAFTDELSTLKRAIAGFDADPSAAGGRPERALAPRRTPGEESPLAGVKAAPGMIYQQHYNWVLAEARIRSGLKPGEIGSLLNPPLSTAQYRRIEEGSVLPSPDQIAQLCSLLEVKAEDAFVLAGPEPPPPGARSTWLKGFSVVGVLRARRRISAKELCTQIQLQTGVVVPLPTLTKLERGELTVHKESPIAQAIAQFFEIPVEWVNRQVPPSMIRRAAGNTRQLHQALKEVAEQLPVLSVEKPHLLTEGNTDE